mgnify:CR=1 FL=1
MAYLESKGYSHIIGKTIAELDLRNEQVVLDSYNQEQPEVVIGAAEKIGGFLANDILTLPSRIQYSNYTGC